MYEELVKRLRSYNGWALNKTLDELDEAANAIEELSKPKWIPVTERLPELYEDVQILFPNNQAVGFYDERDDWCIYTGDGWFSIVAEDEGKPTHWAKKLPEPPKEET